MLVIGSMSKMRILGDEIRSGDSDYAKGNTLRLKLTNAGDFSRSSFGPFADCARSIGNHFKNFFTMPNSPLAFFS
jgi:hypothetical protein